MNILSVKNLARVRLGKTSLLMVIIAGAVALNACGGGGGAGSGQSTSGDAAARLQLVYPGTDQREVVLKSAYVRPSTRTITLPDKRVVTTSDYQFTLANYDLDTSRGAASMSAAPQADDQVKLVISISGDEGENAGSPLKAVSYAPNAPNYRRVNVVMIHAPKGGEQKPYVLSGSLTTGEMKITSVDGDTVTGELNLADGSESNKQQFKSVKGHFTAKLLKGA